MLKPAHGFTLIELLVTLTIVGILTTLAMPSYTEYVREGRLPEATNNLANYRVQMEQYYQDNRTYANGSGACGAALPGASNAQYFTYACTITNNGDGYTATATGILSSLTTGLVYTIDQQNNKTTSCNQCAWSRLPANANVTWITSPS